MICLLGGAHHEQMAKMVHGSSPPLRLSDIFFLKHDSRIPNGFSMMEQVRLFVV